jgi:hypothetical protein
VVLLAGRPPRQSDSSMAVCVVDVRRNGDGMRRNTLQKLMTCQKSFRT